MTRYRIKRVEKPGLKYGVCLINDDLIELEPVEEKSDVKTLSEWLQTEADWDDYDAVAQQLIEMGLDVGKIRGGK